MPNGILHSGYTDKTQATTRLVIVLEKKWRWRQQLFERELAHFGSTDRNERTGQSGPPSKVVPNIAVGPNRNGLFHLISIRNFRNFGLNGKGPM